jgi:signal transduction histidine kinase
VYYLAAGAATGVFSMLFDRWAVAFQRVTDDALRARERASKLAERQSLARQIHDSVLHGLGVIIRRGSQLADEDTVSKRDVVALTEMAREQERALNELVRREPEDVPEGRVSLRDQLARISAGIDSVRVTFSAGDLTALPIHHADELAAAVEQALDNVVQHARATRAGVFLDREGEHVIVSVRDNGTGFVYDEASLRAAGRVGILRSMKGRITDLGGTMRVKSAPGLGTEVEFRVPVPEPSIEEGRQ